MSAFRSGATNDLITAAGHPSRAYDMLVELHKQMEDKIKWHIDSGNTRHREYMLGLEEMAALIGNLKWDIAYDYGYVERQDERNEHGTV